MELFYSKLVSYLNRLLMIAFPQNAINNSFIKSISNLYIITLLPILSLNHGKILPNDQDT